MKKAAPEKIYQLKVALKYARPPIWRRIQVRSLIWRRLDDTSILMLALQRFVVEFRRKFTVLRVREGTVLYAA